MLVSIGRIGGRWEARVYDQGTQKRPVLRAIVRGSLGYVRCGVGAIQDSWAADERQADEESADGAPRPGPSHR